MIKKRGYRYVLFFILMLALTVTGCSHGTRDDGPVIPSPTGEEPSPSPSQTDPVLEQIVFQKVNEYRITKGLKALSLEQKLTDQARIHSKNMAEGKVPFGHDGAEERIEATGIPYSNAGENVAWNSPGYPNPATAAVEGWINSEGHRRNIEGNFDITGIGVSTNTSGTYFTQIFMLRR